MIGKYWVRVHQRDKRAVHMADRHYSRQKPGTPEFTRPGNKVVLVQFDIDGETPIAVWASQRPDPKSGIKRADNLHAWDCSMFRVEKRTVEASELIKEAVAITKAIWSDEQPLDGFVTTVNQKHVPPTRCRKGDFWGFCYLKAGWRDKGLTKQRKLVLLQLPWEELEKVEPVIPYADEFDRKEFRG